MGGQGKSEICLHVANEVRERFWGIFWVDVSTRTSAEESFSEIAEALGCAKTVDAVRKTLSNLPPTSRWLLILDNADDPYRDYQDYFPSGNRGAILMTSRNSQCGLLATTSGHEELDGLEELECVQLLQRTARLSEVSCDSEDYGFAVTLVQHLGHHTLAILQAGSYIASTHCSISEYLYFFRTNRQRLLEKSRGQGQSRYDTVYATFGASMEFLESQETGSSEETRRDSLQILEVLSTLHYASVPLDFLADAWGGAKEALKTSKKWNMHSQYLTPWHVARVPYLVKSEKDDVRLRITNAVARLESLALVRTDKSARAWKSVSMHPLVHGWAGDCQSQQERKEALRMTECIVALSNLAVLKWRPYHPQLAPHLKRLVELDEDLVDDAAQCRSVLQLCVSVAWTLCHTDLHRDLYEFMCRIFQRLDLDDGKPTVELRGVYRAFAEAVRRDGNRPAQAVRILQAIVRLDKETLDEDHRERLSTMCDLGEAYRLNHQPKEAVELSREMVKAHQRLGAAWDLPLPEHGLALALHDDGQIKEAIMLLENVVMDKQRLHSEADPERLVSENVLAVAYLKDGQIAEATRRLEQLALNYVQTLGEEHSHTTNTQFWLAGAYKQAGRFSEAIELYERVVNTRTLVLDKTHPELLGSWKNLATSFLKVGRIQEATDILEYVVHTGNSTLDDTHQLRLECQHGLARAYLEAGRVSEAVGILERVVGIRMSILEEKDPYLLGAQAELGRAYLQAGRAVEAIGILEHVVNMESMVYDDTNPYRVASQGLLRMAYATHDASFSSSESILESRSVSPDPVLQPVEASDLETMDDGPIVGASEEDSINDEPSFEASEEDSINDEPSFEASEEDSIDDEPSFEASEEDSIDDEPSFEASEEDSIDDQPSFEAPEEDIIDDEPTVENGGQRPETSRDILEGPFSSNLMLRERSRRIGGLRLRLSSVFSEVSVHRLIKGKGDQAGRKP